MPTKEHLREQFPIPAGLETVPEDTSVRIAEEVLKLLEEPMGNLGSLTLRKRVELGRITCSTLGTRTASIGEHLGEGLEADHRRVSADIVDMRRTLTERGIDWLSIEGVIHPDHYQRVGFYIRSDKTPDAKSTAPQRDLPAVIEKIQSRIADLLEKLKDLPPLENPSQAFPIESPDKEAVSKDLAAIEAEVAELVKDNDPTAKLSPRIKKILKILLETTKTGKAATAEYVMDQLPAEEKKDLDIKKLRTILNKLLERFRTGGHVKIEVKTQHRIDFKDITGYFLSLKQKKAESTETVELSPPIVPLDERQKTLVLQVLDYLHSIAKKEASIQFTIIVSLKEACKDNKSITPAYCRQKFRELYPGKEPPAESQFEDPLRHRIKRELAEFGISIKRDKAQGFQAVPPEDQKEFDIAERTMAVYSAKKLDETEAETLKERVEDGIRHMAARDADSLKAVLDVMLTAAKNGEYLSIAEIIERAGLGKAIQDPERVRKWFVRIQEINEKHPKLLGFTVTMRGKEFYKLDLLDQYEKGSLDNKDHKFSCPVDVEEGTNFDKTVFDRELASPIKKPRQPDAKTVKQAYKVLAAIADYSQKGKAIPSVIAGAQLGEVTQEEIRKIMERAEGLVEEIGNPDIRLVRYNNYTFYLTTNSRPNTPELNDIAARIAETRRVLSLDIERISDRILQLQAQRRANIVRLEEIADQLEESQPNPQTINPESIVPPPPVSESESESESEPEQDQDPDPDPDQDLDPDPTLPFAHTTIPIAPRPPLSPEEAAFWAQPTPRRTIEKVPPPFDVRAVNLDTWRRGIATSLQIAAEKNRDTLPPRQAPIPDDEEPRRERKAQPPRKPATTKEPVDKTATSPASELEALLSTMSDRPAPAPKPAPTPPPTPAPKPAEPAPRPTPDPASKPPTPASSPASTKPAAKPAPKPAPSHKPKPVPSHRPKPEPDDTDNDTDFIKEPAPRREPPLTALQLKAHEGFELTDLIATLAVRYLSPDRPTTIQDLQTMSAEITTLLGRQDLDAKRRERLAKIPKAISIVLAMARLRGSKEISDASKASLKGLLLGNGQSTQEAALKAEQSAVKTTTASPAKASAKAPKAPKPPKDEEVTTIEEGPAPDPREIRSKGRSDFDDGQPTDLTHIFPQDED